MSVYFIIYTDSKKEMYVRKHVFAGVIYKPRNVKDFQEATQIKGGTEQIFLNVIQKEATLKAMLSLMSILQTAGQ